MGCQRIGRTPKLLKVGEEEEAEEEEQEEEEEEEEEGRTLWEANLDDKKRMEETAIGER